MTNETKPLTRREVTAAIMDDDVNGNVTLDPDRVLALIAERDTLLADLVLWRKATGYDDYDALDFSLGRAGVDYHLNVLGKRAEVAERGCQSLRAELEAARGERDEALALLRRMIDATRQNAAAYATAEQLKVRAASAALLAKAGGR